MRPIIFEHTFVCKQASQVFPFCVDVDHGEPSPRAHPRRYEETLDRSGQTGPIEPTPPARYWLLTWALIAFGVITGFSIGIPFLLLGLALALLAPVRQRAAVFWPVLAGVAAFVVAYVLVSPLGCSSWTRDSSPPFTSCTNAIGIEYSGWGDYEPSHVPALLAGLAAGAALATLVRVAVRRIQSATG